MIFVMIGCINQLSQLYNFYYNFLSSFLTQIIFVMMPGRQPFNYHLCTNSIKASDLVDPSIKTNWQLLFFLCFSVIIHILVQLKTKFYKYKSMRSVHIISKTDFIKNVGIIDIDKHSMSSLATNILNVLLMSSTFVFFHNCK